ncbi:hypothetical protein J1N35_041345 [Gossypium stocksii]|uniref:C2H2-type domain-containing protein n=1 Tax=Gossypium stocksii TaxID=47602 RepID=A0A9D3UFB0_9ROSI|nr:hypothetical protein J1N35_041345 [Gossypium stocksii]
MVMEGQQEVVLCKDELQIIKGKRTKRQRPASPLTLAIASTTTTSTGGESRTSNDDSSITTSVEPPESCWEDEENMAYCLMLLAQGQTRKPSEPTGKTARMNVHQCKTCNRCFPSFQALGGHRASHKKPKLHSEENTKRLKFVKEDDDMNTTLSLQITNKAPALCNGTKSKVHECSICGAEFSSGQALGGHMRRHRTSTNATTTVGTSNSAEREDQSSNRPTTVLQLDLNLPAPEDDRHNESNFPITQTINLCYC